MENAQGSPASGRTPQRYSTICLDLATTKENQQWERSHLGLDRDYGETAPPLDWKGTERGAASRTLCSCRRVGKSSAEIITADARPERGGPACRALDPVTSHPPGTTQRLRGRRRESDLKAWCSAQPWGTCSWVLLLPPLKNKKEVCLCVVCMLLWGNVLKAEF